MNGLDPTVAAVFGGVLGLMGVGLVFEISVRWLASITLGRGAGSEVADS